MKKKSQCRTCDWWEIHPKGTVGFCKRFPPVFTRFDDRDFPRFYNPTTGATSSCGEHSDYLEG